MKMWLLGIRGWENGELSTTTNGCRVSVLQDEEYFGDLLYNNVNVLHTTELYT